jgi:hypothetical protein
MFYHQRPMSIKSNQSLIIKSLVEPLLIEWLTIFEWWMKFFFKQRQKNKIEQTKKI